MIATGSATRSPAKIFGSAAGSMIRRRMIRTARTEILCRPDQPSLNSAKAEITGHDDRIEAFEKGECDLRQRSDAEDVREHRKQRDLRDRIAHEENRLEQVAPKRRSRHRGRETEYRPARRAQIPPAPGRWSPRHDRQVVHCRSPPPALPTPAPGSATSRDWTNPLPTATCHSSSSSGIEYQRPMIFLDLRDHCTTCSSVPIRWPLST